MPIAVTHKIGSAGFSLYSYIGWPSFDKEIGHGETFHSLESGWLSLKGPEMLGGVACAALCCTALTQAIRAGAPSRQASIKLKKMLLCDIKNIMILIKSRLISCCKVNGKNLRHWISPYGNLNPEPAHNDQQLLGFKMRQFIVHKEIQKNGKDCISFAVIFLEVTCSRVWPLPLIINPQHPFVPWVSPLPLSILKTCETTRNLRHPWKKFSAKNSPIAVLAISVVVPSGLIGKSVRWLLAAASRSEGTAGKALSQQRRGLPVRLVVC